MTKMLSNLIVTQQKFVLIIDYLGQEAISQKFLTQFLKEQGEDGAVKIFRVGAEWNLDELMMQCDLKSDESKPWNVILPPLSDFLAYEKPSQIFNCINKLKDNKNVKRTFLWISPENVQCNKLQFLIAACEYMSDLVLYLETTKELTILTRKPGGGVTKNTYTYSRTKTEFTVQLKTVESRLKSTKDDEEKNKNEPLSTFKIEMDEDEMVVRKAMKMPYEKALEATESNISYTPDAADDFDDEDPDEDLDI